MVAAIPLLGRSQPATASWHRAWQKHIDSGSSQGQRVTAKVKDAIAVGARSAAEDDRELMHRLCAADAVAFRQLVQRHLASVVAVGRRIMADDTEAEDVAQEVMLRLWRQASDLEVGSAGIGPWLRRVAFNLSIDRIRSSRRIDVTDEVPEKVEEATQLTGLAASELGARVDIALKSLPERQRLALTLFHFEGLSQIEVGTDAGGIGRGC